MRDENRVKRQEQIAQAAYELLDLHGYDGISMLKIARRAKASNETLYKWYGDKRGLFHALVESNAKDVSTLLSADEDGTPSALETLDILGPRLLGVLVGSRAVALNRAAAADPSGELGKALAKAGRETIMPLIVKVFQRICADKGHPPENAAKITETYLKLLVGDLQIRRVTGAIKQPSQAAIHQLAEEAEMIILRLMEDADGIF